MMNEKYCWNYKENAQIKRSSMRNIYADSITDVIFCSRCNAILSPERNRCGGCGKYRRGFIIGAMIHSGATRVAICKECIISEYISERRKGMGLQ